MTFPSPAFEHHHRLGFAAGSEENVILHVNSKPGASAASTGEIVVGGEPISIHESAIASELTG